MFKFLNNLFFPEEEQSIAEQNGWENDKFSRLERRNRDLKAVGRSQITHFSTNCSGTLASLSTKNHNQYLLGVNPSGYAIQLINQELPEIYYN